MREREQNAKLTGGDFSTGETGKFQPALTNPLYKHVLSDIIERFSWTSEIFGPLTQIMPSVTNHKGGEMRASCSFPIVFALLVFGLSSVLPAEDLAETSRQNSQCLIDTARDVLIEGVKLGLDEAGTHLLGASGWKAFKQVFSPVAAALKQRFPALSFGTPADERAIVAGRDAAEYLAHNTELQKMLLEKFDSLAGGQEEILSSVRRLERLAASESQEHQEQLETARKTLETVRQILDELERQRGVVRSAELPTVVDVSDDLQEAKLIMLARRRRQGYTGLGYFDWANLSVVGTLACRGKVAEQGKTGVTYTCRVPGRAKDRYKEETTIAATEKYVDENSRLCRKIKVPEVIVKFREDIYCQQDGHWKLARSGWPWNSNP